MQTDLNGPKSKNNIWAAHQGPRRQRRLPVCVGDKKRPVARATNVDAAHRPFVYLPDPIPISLLRPFCFPPSPLLPRKPTKIPPHSCVPPSPRIRERERDRERERAGGGGGGNGDPGFAAAAEVDHGAHQGGGAARPDGGCRHLLLAPQGCPLLRRPPLQGHSHHQVRPSRPALLSWTDCLGFAIGE